MTPLRQIETERDSLVRLITAAEALVRSLEPYDAPWRNDDEVTDSFQEVYDAVRQARSSVPFDVPELEH